MHGVPSWQGLGLGEPGLVLSLARDKHLDPKSLNFHLIAFSLYVITEPMLF